MDDHCDGCDAVMLFSVVLCWLSVCCEGVLLSISSTIVGIILLLLQRRHTGSSVCVAASDNVLFLSPADWNFQNNKKMCQQHVDIYCVCVCYRDNTTDRRTLNQGRPLHSTVLCDAGYWRQIYQTTSSWLCLVLGSHCHYITCTSCCSLFCLLCQYPFWFCRHCYDVTALPQTSNETPYTH